MTETPQHDIVELMREFSTAMLVTRAKNGDVRSRPMAIAQVGDDGVVYFSTDNDSEKVDEIAAHPEVNVSFQDDRRFVSLSGRAEISNDRALIAELWKPDWKIWFPEGKDDPNIRLVRVEGRRGEMWDISGLGSGLEFLWKAGKALVQGKKMSDAGEHGKVELR